MFIQLIRASGICLVALFLWEACEGIVAVNVLSLRSEFYGSMLVC